MKLAMNVWEYFTTYGLSETLAYTRHWLSERLHERYYGIWTRKKVDLTSLGYDEQYVSHDPCPYRGLKTILRSLPIREEDVLIDYGSGAGRAALIAARMYPFKTVIGVELVPSLVGLAQQNLKQVRLKLACDDVRFLEADATTYQLPNDVTIALFINPFTGDPFQQVLANIEESLKAAPRSFLIVIVNPSVSDLPPWMKLVKSLETYLYDCDIYEVDRQFAARTDNGVHRV